MRRSLTLKRMSVFVGVFAIVGASALVLTNAATDNYFIEPETSSVSGNASVVANTSASGGQAVQFDAEAGGGSNPPVTTGKRCSLHVHWAGGNGQSDGTSADPNGNYWRLWPSSPDGGFWLYDGPHNYTSGRDPGNLQYDRLVTFLKNYLNSRNCGPTLMLGYSNGGGLASMIFCKGEDFGGRLWGVITDDPVMDEGVLNCNPSANVREVLFTHSEELASVGNASAPSNSCNWDPPYDWPYDFDNPPTPGQGTGWYCKNNRSRTLAQFQANVGHNSVLQRQYHSGGGWTNNSYASWHQESVFWTTRF